MRILFWFLWAFCCAATFAAILNGGTFSAAITALLAIPMILIAEVFGTRRAAK